MTLKEILQEIMDEFDDIDGGADAQIFYEVFALRAHVIRQFLSG